MSQHPDHKGLGFLDVIRHEERGKHRGDGEGGEQSPAQRVGVGSSHRPEDLSLHSLHGKERHESRHRDQGGKQHGFVHLQYADQNQTQTIGPPGNLLGSVIGHGGRVLPEKAIP